MVRCPHCEEEFKVMPVETMEDNVFREDERRQESGLEVFERDAPESPEEHDRKPLTAIMEDSGSDPDFGDFINETDAAAW